MRGDVISMTAVITAQIVYHIESWWRNASAADYGALALCVVVCAWFLTRYYSD